MKKLVTWGVLILAGSNGAFAQGPSEPETTAHAAYAVNTSVSSSITAGQNLNDQIKVQDDDAVRVKNISKSFPAGKTDKVVLSNQFGSMLIKVWDRREVKIDISIRSYSNNDREAQELIDQVNINADKNGDVISCKTTIGNGNRWSGRNKRREVKVNYVVYLPASNALDLSQQFGNVNMGDFSGPLTAKVQYGDFNAGNLSDASNYISVQYGKTNIQELNKATIKQQYGSGLTIGTAGTLDLNAQYANVSITAIRGDALIKQQYGSGLKIGSVNNLDLDVQYASVNVTAIKGNATIKQQYNSLTIGNVGRLSLRSEYTGVNVGTLRGDGDFKMSYNNFNIGEVSPGCRSLIIDVDYVDVNLGFSDSFNGDFSVQKTYGAFRYGSSVRVNALGENDKHSSTKNYSGKIGNGGSARVQIKSDYGAVVFK
ncbi:hypothetical protein [Pedobacter hartonius]|uniref:Adhesin n=1 Tax=Pedobacter hartonius TaxID=425514 RepID=A0A1H4FDQ1_9SPHI|nr:hypothetical protein [Pedobacter hartonius]SEA95479.1 hypothetical protein SAMN05443550_107153 [Pedobacter hartonius]